MAESTIQTLVLSLKIALNDLRSDKTTRAALRNADGLPDKGLYTIASEALDLLSELRLELEPSHLVLADHFMGYMNTKALCTAVDMNIPDLLSDGPVTHRDLSEKAGARPDRFRQIMRTLVNNGIFSFDPKEDSYQNNETSRLLASDHWTQWRNWVEVYGNEFYDMARGIPSSCKTDASRCPAQINFDTDDSMFKYFTDQGWMPKFLKTLSGGATAQAPGILHDYPWQEVANETILDLGGGSGGLISLLLGAHPTMKGGVLDLSKGIEQAKLNFHTTDGQYYDVGSRVPLENLIIGDFMEHVPSFEVYTMKWCLHDWDDEHATKILKNVRAAIKKGPKSRLVILESVLQDGHVGRMSRYADLNMMVAVGGRERDEREWERLATVSGWTIGGIHILRGAWPCAIEFLPDWSWSPKS